MEYLIAALVILSVVPALGMVVFFVISKHADRRDQRAWDRTYDRLMRAKGQVR